MSNPRLLLTEEQRAIQHAVRAVVSRFDADYWLERDDDGEFHEVLLVG